MRVLLDNNVNYRFGKLLAGHDVVHVQNIGWENLKNGNLIAEAESSGYDVLVTADKQMLHQQNLTGRTVAIIILGSLKITLKDISPLAPQVLAILNGKPMKGLFVIVKPTES